ncbi:prepilin peptidase [Candidatus Pacearchaeota archaeon]|nr:prepilin peptidase [Candidatus Pacearchaeota archaeon]
MELFLIILTLAWLIFASIQDLRTREVANWLTFSLIVFALIYKAFYSVAKNEWSHFLLALAGFGLFFILAHIFYYGKVFAGGDAKLLMGIGALLPFEIWGDYFYLTTTFLFFLFLSGAIYSLVYSALTSVKMSKKFIPAFGKNWRRFRLIWLIPLIFSIFLFFVKPSLEAWFLISAFFFFLPLAYIYLKSFEEECLIVLLSPNRLYEGDWLEKDVKIGGKLLRKSIHGLSSKDISFLRSNGKKVWIKQGIPFVPAFLIAFLIMVFFGSDVSEAIQDLILFLS